MPTCYIDEEIVWQSIQCLDKAIETAFPPMEEEEGVKTAEQRPSCSQFQHYGVHVRVDGVDGILRFHSRTVYATIQIDMPIPYAAEV